MSRLNTLLISALIIIITVFGKQYVDDQKQHVMDLEKLIVQQQKVINDKNKQVVALSQIVQSMYYNQTGRQLPNNWHFIPKQPDTHSPIH